MTKPELFLDSSALFAGVASPHGAARVLLLMAEAELITVTVSEQVVTETERAVARKVPRALTYLRETLRSTGLRIVRDPPPREIDTNEYRDIIAHRADLPIVVAAIKARVDYLVTHNRQHFIDDPNMAARSGLCMGIPGDALAWVRERLVQD